ncbi:tagatose-bisphosphate aldolase [Chelonobacter oris]|uniref:D-tagatose-1,6-bisphosphate aldolase subunit GatZ n=1 Tax=Chelonobacter oris TaxID=505317 RepID=A0A0A3ANJ8_9PAST|nr:tagatose-bisphosphate aldolase subunit GatZ [Chelonobacter oris]KGQ70926.1 tagatose-bisphosphate aldolase [Chelonobacter oris]
MKRLFHLHKSGKPVGICSVCSAHPLVIEAALTFELETSNAVLIEATSNQVNQFGGYTTMTPNDFKRFVYSIADKVGFPVDRIILGGDHLGPNCWKNESAESAMAKSKILVIDYAKAGFTKIHLDTSMSCQGDPIPLSPKTVAERAAILCHAIESNISDIEREKITYIIGTEVPVPGGETHAINTIDITTVDSAQNTIDTHRSAFKKLGLDDAFQRVIGIVVQPGVEFDHSSIVSYKPELAQALSRFIETTPYLFEAHSTDYQTPNAYKALVRDHFAILKVGPALTFALREALFALAKIEESLIHSEKQSYLLNVIGDVMQDNPEHWQQYYSSLHSKAMIDLYFSLSDRIRYYWPNQRIVDATDKLISNLSEIMIPLGLLSQYLPIQYHKVVAGTLAATPHELIIDKIQNVLEDYAGGCKGE